MTEKIIDSEVAVISCFNHDPTEIVSKFANVVLYDSSSDESFQILVDKLFPKRIRVANTGTSLANYFSFIISNWGDLPSSIYFLKSNLVPRHVTANSFNKKLKLLGLIPFFNDEKFKDKRGIAYHLIPGYFVERNNSWFMKEREPKYFSSCDELMTWLFLKPILPEYLLFAPGANYKTYSDNLKQYPKVFWQLLYHITSYTFFPPEAYIVERILFIIFTGEYELNAENFQENWLEKLETKKATEKVGKAPEGAESFFMTKISWIKKKLFSKIIYELEKRKLI